MQESRLQLLVAAKQMARSILQPLYPTVGVQAGWPTNRTLAQIGTDTANPDPAQRQVNPLVALSFGPSNFKASPAQSSRLPITLPPARGASLTTTLYAVDWEQVPLLFAIIAAGDQAERLRSGVATALMAGLGISRTLLLPDTAEQATNAWVPDDSTYGLTATLLRAGRMDMDTPDADVRGLRRTHVTYTANLTYYTEQQSTIIQSVDVTQEIGQTVIPTPPPSPPPLP